MAPIAHSGVTAQRDVSKFLKCQLLLFALGKNLGKNVPIKEVTQVEKIAHSTL